MSAIAFDTHEFVKELREAGFSEQQAEVITKLQKQSIGATLDQAKQEYQLDELVTKRDIRELELKFESRIKETELKIELVRSDLKKEIAETKSELIRWVVGVGVLQTVIITALLLKLSSSI